MSKKSYFIIFILFVIILSFAFFMGRGNKAEAPTVQTDGVVDSTMPVIPDDSTPPLEEMQVVSEGIINNEGVREFIISGSDFIFKPSVINVKKGDRVRIIFENTAGFHDLRIDEYGVATKQAKAPYQEILEFTALKVGSFEYYCSVGSHRAMGMKGTLNVE
jgi:plastocyanin